MQQEKQEVMDSREVLLVGGECVPPKLVALIPFIEGCMQNPDVVIVLAFNSEGYPRITRDNTIKAIAGQNYPDVGGVAVNVQHHLDEAVACVKSGDNDMAFRHMIWFELIKTVLHEFAHQDLAAIMGRDGYDSMSSEDVEDKVEEMTLLWLEDLAKTVDIETPDLDDWPFLGPEIYRIEQANRDLKEEWAIKQVMLIDDDLVAWEEKTGTQIRSIREFVQYISNSVGEDGWDVPVVEIVTRFEEPVIDVEVVETACEAPTSLPAEEIAACLDAEPDAPVIDLGVQDQPIAATVISGDDEYPEFPMEEGFDGDVEFDDNFNAMSGMDGTEDIDAMVDSQSSGVTAVGGMTPVDRSQFPTGPAGATPGYQQPVYQQTPQGFASKEQAIAALIPVTHAPHQHAGNHVSAVAQEVYTRMFCHIYQQCGWTAGPAACFTADHMIMAPLDCRDLVGAAEIFPVIISTKDDHGNMIYNVPSGGVIKGTVTKAAGLPGYKIGLNVGDGRIRTRIIMPQNPNKPGENSAAVKSGSKLIGWVMDGDHNKHNMGKVWLIKMVYDFATGGFSYEPITQ